MINVLLFSRSAESESESTEVRVSRLRQECQCDGPVTVRRPVMASRVVKVTKSRLETGGFFKFGATKNRTGTGNLNAEPESQAAGLSGRRREGRGPASTTGMPRAGPQFTSRFYCYLLSSFRVLIRLAP